MDWRVEKGRGGEGKEGVRETRTGEPYLGHGADANLGLDEPLLSIKRQKRTEWKRGVAEGWGVEEKVR